MKKLVTYCDVCEKMIRKNPQEIVVEHQDPESKWAKSYSYDSHKKCARDVMDQLKCLATLPHIPGMCSICNRPIEGKVFRVLKVDGLRIPKEISDMEVCPDCARNFIKEVEKAYKNRCRHRSKRPPIVIPEPPKIIGRFEKWK